MVMIGNGNLVDYRLLNILLSWGSELNNPNVFILRAVCGYRVRFSNLAIDIPYVSGDSGLPIQALRALALTSKCSALSPVELITVFFFNDFLFPVPCRSSLCCCWCVTTVTLLNSWLARSVNCGAYQERLSRFWCSHLATVLTTTVNYGSWGKHS